MTQQKIKIIGCLSLYANEKTDLTHSDRVVADKICAALESEGISCWIDHRNIMPGEEWLKAILNAIECSDNTWCPGAKHSWVAPPAPSVVKAVLVN